MITGRYPDGLLRTFIAPAFKGKPDDNAENCSDYRGIQYADVVSKALGNVILTLVQEPFARTRATGEMQHGFTLRRDRSMAIADLLQRGVTAGPKGFLCIFGDLRAAFDRVPWDLMQASLRKAGLSEMAAAAFVNRMQAEAEVFHRPSGTRSRRFRRDKGTCQGDPISPVGFAASLQPSNEFVRRECAGKGARLCPTGAAGGED